MRACMNESLLPYIKEAIRDKEVYPGYPTQRLVIPEFDAQKDALPSGPWTINDTNQPSQQDSDAFVRAGYEIDTIGRPLHPFIHQMITDSEVGVVTGKGFYWNWGPNFTADAVVITSDTQPKVLLVQRADTGTWALPGGFVDPKDASDLEAAQRELQEETALNTDAEGILLYRGVVGDLRTTAHAWAETSAYLFRIPAAIPVHGCDDATDAQWFPLENVGTSLFGSHTFLIDQAISALRK